MNEPSPTNIKILHVAETLRGGISSYFQEILPAQVAQFGPGNVRCLVPQSHVKDLAFPSGVVVTTFADSKSRVHNALSLLSSVRLLQRNWHASIVHAHSSFAGLSVRLGLGIKFSPRPKIVYAAHGWAFDRDGAGIINLAFGLAERLMAYLTDAIVCISPHDYDSALRFGLPKSKLITIGNAIADTAAKQLPVSWPEVSRRFIFVGRLDRQKGVDVLLEAIRLLPPAVFVYIVGSQVVSKEAPSLALPSNVKITGWLPREEVQAYIQSSDVVVIPSRWEGFGLVALEAMRCGKPVIASSVGGLKSLVFPGETGWLVQPGDSTDLAKAMRESISADIEHIGQNGRALFLSHYTSDRLNRELNSLYLALCRTD